MSRRNAPRDAAIALGLRRYSTAKPCKHGHLAERMVSNRRCVVCLELARIAWRSENLSTCSEQKRRWCAKNREKVRALKRNYYRNSARERENQARRSRQWLESNREKSRASSAKWRETHLETAAAAQQRRRARKLRQMPPWADHEKIRQFYALAKELTEQTGIEHEVDHIVPLQGKLVSGLHIETNLQVLPKKANRAKGARFPRWGQSLGEIQNGLYP